MRDVVGDLTDAVRDQGLRMALYYSGGLDWAFNEARVEDVADVWGTIVQTPRIRRIFGRPLEGTDRPLSALDHVE